MLKILFLPFLLLGSFISKQPKASVSNNDAFVLEEIASNEYKVIGVKEEYQNSEELRVYGEEFSSYNIVSIDGTAFNSCSNLKALMVSYSIKEVLNLSATSSFKDIYYTGNESTLNDSGITFDSAFNIHYEAFDEGFIYKWNNEVRPTSESNLCDISESLYLEIKSLYELLDEDDKSVVDSYVDKAGATIKDSLKTLKDHFSPKPHPEERKEPSQKTMITLILIIAAFGMTVIGAFYLLKDKKIIN